MRYFRIRAVARRLVALFLRLLPAGVVRWFRLRPYRACRARLLAVRRDPSTTQTQQLVRILRYNQFTEFGRAHGFGDIADLAQFRRRVPVRSYGELEPFIQRERAGEQHVLAASAVQGVCADPPVTDKVFPLTEESLRRALYAEQLLRSEVIRACRWPASSGTWLHVLPLHGDASEAPLAAQLAYRGGRSELAVAPEVFTIEEDRRRLYLALRLSLGQPVSVLRAECPGTLAVVAATLNEQAEPLLEDLAAGRVSGLEGLPATVRSALPTPRANPALAGLLRTRKAERGRLHPEDVWPRLGALVCSTAGRARPAFERLADHFGPIPVVDAGWQRCWGSLFNAGPPLEGGLAAVDGQVMEFIPVGEDREALPVDALDPGERYQPVVTGHNGLYRYLVETIVEVVEIEGGIPRLAVIGPVPRRLPLGHGGRLDQSQLQQAVEAASQAMGASLGAYTCWIARHASEVAADSGRRPADEEATGAARRGFLQRFIARSRNAPARTESVNRPALVWAVESQEEQDEQVFRLGLQAFEQHLQSVCPAYAQQRGDKTLESARLLRLRAGSFAQIQRHQLAAGWADAHDPPPPLQATPLRLDANARVRQLSL